MQIPTTVHSELVFCVIFPSSIKWSTSGSM